MSSFPAVSFQQISQILELTDQLDLSREAVEIPLSPESPGVVHRLANGKIEIVVDADLPFDEWLPTVTPKVQALMTEDSSSQDYYQKGFKRMAVRDREWPGYTLWYCCQDCGRLWTYQGHDVVALDLTCSLGPASIGEGVSPRMCAICEGRCHAPAAEI